MRSTLLSFDRRAVRRSAMALAAVTTLAACDTDAPVSPNPSPSHPTTSNPAVISPSSRTGTLLITIVDQAQLPPTTTHAQFTVSGPGVWNMIVQDNVTQDADLTVGSIRVKGLTVGDYTVCETIPPEHYVMPYVTCQSATVTGGSTAMLTFQNVSTARMSWRVVDHLGNLIEGMSFTGTDTNRVVTQLADEGWGDLDSTRGQVEIEAPEGSYQLCQGALPAGYVLPPGQASSCFTRVMGNGLVQVLPDMVIHPEYSAYWQVQLQGTYPYPSNLGQASFEVKSLVNGGFSKYVFDNGADDFDGRLGFVATMLPATGTYLVCQSMAPDGFKLPSPACTRISVSLGEPKDAGVFVDPYL